MTDASRKCFGRLSNQVARCAAEDQEAGSIVWPVDQDAEYRKEFRAALDFVDDHESA